jgi:hypothetical protein
MNVAGVLLQLQLAKPAACSARLVLMLMPANSSVGNTGKVEALLRVMQRRSRPFLPRRRLRTGAFHTPLPFFPLLVQ